MKYQILFPGKNIFLFSDEFAQRVVKVNMKNSTSDQYISGSDIVALHADLGLWCCLSHKVVSVRRSLVIT